MRVAIARAHGQIGRRLGRLLVGRGDHVLGLIRTPEHAAELRAAGMHPVVCDVEHATIDGLAAAVGRSHVVVFAAGAGAGTGRVRLDWVPVLGAISRDDVAALLAAVGHHPRATHHILYVTSGGEPIDEALDCLLAERTVPNASPRS